MTFAERGRSSRFLRFLLAGGIAALANVFSRLLLSEWLPLTASVLIAYLCGMLTAWLLNRRFVFEASGRSRSRELLRFSLVNVVAAAQVWLVTLGLADWLFPKIGYTFHSETTAHLLGVVVPVFTSFLAHSRYSFAK